MLRSMTGFAQVHREEPPFVVRVTLKTFNHRFLDLHIRLGPELEGLEPSIRTLARQQIRRGHVEVNVQAESSEKPSLNINREFVRRYIEWFEELRREHRLAVEPDLMAILRMPGVVQASETLAVVASDSKLPVAVERALAEALEELDRMRRAEGAALEQELRQRAESLGGLLEQVERVGAGLSAGVMARLRKRLEELLSEVPVDEARLVQEAAYLAERSDVSEEVARLRSHREQFLKLLARDGAVGKQLDFLLQEMNRETNTLLSKSPALDAGGLGLTQAALAMKAEIERLREQVQNVE